MQPTTLLRRAMTTPGYEIDKNSQGLTKRERELLMLLIAGETQKEAADSLGISKQRTNQLTNALVAKGFLERLDNGTMRVTVVLGKDSP